MSLAAGSRIGPYEIRSLLGTLRLRSGQAGGWVRCGARTTPGCSGMSR